MSVMLREQPYAADHASSVRRTMDGAGHEPRSLAEYVTWLRREFERETPRRVHERGVEPESAIGSPRLAGAFRAYLCGSPFATDHDDRRDMDMRDAVYVRPVHRAIAIMSKRRPESARLAFALAWSGVDWEDIICQKGLVSEFGYWVTLGTLQHLWRIWARGVA